MKRIPPFILISLLAISPSSHAAPKPKPTPRITSENPADNPQVQKILSDLKPYFPTLTASSVVNTSENDLRELYVQSYEAQHMSMLEAKKKASQLSSDMFQITLLKKD